MSAELEIIDLVVGEGKEAVKGALITTHYTGWLEDGTKFDSSLDRGNYFETVIGTGRVIKGWDQGIMGMKVGGKRKLIVPSHLAYGERKMGNIIPANSKIAAQLAQVHAGDLVQLQGYLVQINDHGWIWRSSLSRVDVGDGACEILRVQAIKWVEKSVG